MTEERDPLLQKLFTESRTELSSPAFTVSVMKQTQHYRYRFYGVAASLGLVLILLALAFTSPLQSMVLGFSHLLATPLLDISAFSIAWFLAPINNVATVVVILGKAGRMVWKRFSTIAYA